MLTCRDVIMDFLADYLEGTLGPDLVRELDEHLQLCAPCQAYLCTSASSCRSNMTRRDA
jgi:predicted anti-sigma-YlaC factor YlaD